MLIVETILIIGSVGAFALVLCKAAGLDAMPVIMKNLADDEASIFMVDSNLQRENILSSERALAYKMKMEALKHQGKRGDLTFRQNGGKSWTAEKLLHDTGESKSGL